MTCNKDITVDFLRQRVQNIKLSCENIIKDCNENYIISGRLIYDVVKNIENQINQDMLKDGLVGEAWIVLMVTYSSENQKIIASDICHHLGKNKSTTSRIVESLINKGFLIRAIDPLDRRKIFLQITELGKNYVLSKIEAHHRYNNDLWNGVNVDVLLEQIIKLQENSKKAKLNENSI